MRLSDWWTCTGDLQRKEESKNKPPKARASGGYFDLSSSLTFLCPLPLPLFVFWLEFVDQFGQVIAGFDVFGDFFNGQPNDF
jgi:hypothetical protein